MTNTRNSFPVDEAETLRRAAAKLERDGGFSLDTEQVDFLTFLIRSIANERDYGAVKYRALQFARTLVSEVESDIELIEGILKREAARVLEERGYVSKISLIKALRAALLAQDPGDQEVTLRASRQLRAVLQAWGDDSYSRVSDHNTLLGAKLVVESWAGRTGEWRLR